MNPIKSFLKTILLLPPSLLSARHLARDPSPKGAQIASAVTEALSESLDPSEAGWAEKIERLRRDLSQNTSTVRMEDFGAGSGDSTRTATEMEQGRFVEMTLAQANRASLPRFWSRLLSKIVRKAKCEKCLEMGSCLGISAAYVGAALEGSEGNLISLDGAKELSNLAQAHIQKLGLTRVSFRVGRFSDVLLPTLKEFGPIDYVFVDGHHDEKATIEYFSTLIPHLKNEAIVVFDDIDWSPGMKNAWSALKKNPHFEVSIDLGSMGVCIFHKNGGATPRQYSFPFLNRLSR